MGMSVPGNSCRPCTNTSAIAGCTIRVPGKCVYYGGSPLSTVSINTGEDYDSILVKLVNAVSASITAAVIPVVSEDFDVDGVSYSNSALNGVNFEIFFNDINRFIYNETGNQEWDYLPGGGFEILIPGFDANVSLYHLYIFRK